MITVGMNYQVVAGRESDFEKVFAGVIKVLEAEPGHTFTRLYRASDEACDYLIVSEWTSREAFERFTHSGAFTSVTHWGLDGVLRGRPTHTVYGRDEVEAEQRDLGAGAGRCPIEHVS